MQVHRHRTLGRLLAEIVISSTLWGASAAWVDAQCIPLLPCDDGNPCTTGENCNFSGECGGGDPTLCIDLDFCTQDTCDPSKGCVFTPVECPGDGNVCTADACVLGNCVHQPIPGLPCDDGNACTGLDACTAPGVCTGGVPVFCVDLDSCTVDSCDPAKGCAFEPIKCDGDENSCTADECVLGSCVHRPLVGSSCDDGNVCNGSEVCTIEGKCDEGLPFLCNDFDPCTLDTCEQPLGCTFTPIVCADDGNPCTIDSCLLGNCHAPVPGIACDDGNPCTENDLCTPDGQCGLSFACVTDSDCSTDVGFRCAFGQCVSCGDLDPCTFDYCDVEQNGCSHLPLSCDDDNPCTFDACANEGFPLGCRHLSATDGSPCDDGNPCTNEDLCTDGSCGSSGLGEPCTSGDDCFLGEVCENGFCARCDDGDACTAESCGAGQCVRASIDCEDNNQCTAESCYPIDGCVYVSQLDSPCDDHNPCTSNDTCGAGNVCQGSAVTGCLTPTPTSTPIASPTQTAVPVATATATPCQLLSGAPVELRAAVVPGNPHSYDLLRVTITFAYPTDRRVRAEAVEIVDLSSAFELESTSAEGLMGEAYTTLFKLQALLPTTTTLNFLAHYEIETGCTDAPIFAAQSSTLAHALTVTEGTPCLGDCDGDAMVTVDELLTMASIALGVTDPDACTRGDSDGDQQITVDEILAAVNFALTGCPVRGG